MTPRVHMLAIRDRRRIMLACGLEGVADLVLGSRIEGRVNMWNGAQPFKAFREEAFDGHATNACGTCARHWNMGLNYANV